MDTPEVPTNPVDKTAIEMHDKVINELLSELPMSAKMIALEVLAKHHQKYSITAPVVPPVADILSIWGKVAVAGERAAEAFTVARRNLIRRLFKVYGFTVKEGETDLKEYVFKAGEALMDRMDQYYREIGVVAIANMGDFSEKTIEHYEAMEDRSKWGPGKWYEHLGAVLDDQGRVVFGSVYAVEKMMELRLTEYVRGIVLAAAIQNKQGE
jgi:intein/homing endonuclease